MRFQAALWVYILALLVLLTVSADLLHSKKTKITCRDGVCEKCVNDQCHRISEDEANIGIGSLNHMPNGEGYHQTLISSSSSHGSSSSNQFDQSGLAGFGRSQTVSQQRVRIKCTNDKCEKCTNDVCETISKEEADRTLASINSFSHGQHVRVVNGGNFGSSSSSHHSSSSNQFDQSGLAGFGSSQTVSQHRVRIKCSNDKCEKCSNDVCETISKEEADRTLASINSFSHGQHVRVVNVGNFGSSSSSHGSSSSNQFDQSGLAGFGSSQTVSQRRVRIKCTNDKCEKCTNDVCETISKEEADRTLASINSFSHGQHVRVVNGGNFGSSSSSHHSSSSNQFDQSGLAGFGSSQTVSQHRVRIKCSNDKCEKCSNDVCETISKEEADRTLASINSFSHGQHVRVVNVGNFGSSSSSHGSSSSNQFDQSGLAGFGSSQTVSQRRVRIKCTNDKCEKCTNDVCETISKEEADRTLASINSFSHGQHVRVVNGGNFGSSSSSHHSSSSNQFDQSGLAGFGSSQTVSQHRVRIKCSNDKCEKCSNDVCETISKEEADRTLASINSFSHGQHVRVVNGGNFGSSSSSHGSSSSNQFDQSGLAGFGSSQTVSQRRVRIKCTNDKCEKCTNDVCETISKEEADRTLASINSFSHGQHVRVVNGGNFGSSSSSHHSSSSNQFDQSGLAGFGSSQTVSQHRVRIKCSNDKCEKCSNDVCETISKEEADRTLASINSFSHGQHVRVVNVGNFGSSSSSHGSSSSNQFDQSGLAGFGSSQTVSQRRVRIKCTNDKCEKCTNDVCETISKEEADRTLASINSFSHGQHVRVVNGGNFGSSSSSHGSSSSNQFDQSGLAGFGSSQSVSQRRVRIKCTNDKCEKCTNDVCETISKEEADRTLASINSFSHGQHVRVVNGGNLGSSSSSQGSSSSNQFDQSGLAGLGSSQTVSQRRVRIKCTNDKCEKCSNDVCETISKEEADRTLASINSFSHGQHVRVVNVGNFGSSSSSHGSSSSNQFDQSGLAGFGSSQTVSQRRVRIKCTNDKCEKCTNDVCETISKEEADRTLASINSFSHGEHVRVVTGENSGSSSSFHGSSSANQFDQSGLAGFGSSQTVSQHRVRIKCSNDKCEKCSNDVCETISKEEADRTLASINSFSHGQHVRVVDGENFGSSSSFHGSSSSNQFDQSGLAGPGSSRVVNTYRTNIKCFNNKCERCINGVCEAVNSEEANKSLGSLRASVNGEQGHVRKSDVSSSSHRSSSKNYKQGSATSGGSSQSHTVSHRRVRIRCVNNKCEKCTNGVCEAITVSDAKEQMETMKNNH